MDRNCSIWIFLCWNLKIVFSYLKSTPSNFSNCKVWGKNKILEFETKICFICVFWAAILKNYCHIWNQCSGVCLIEELDAKIRILKFSTKNTWFGNFKAQIWKYFCHLWNQLPRISLGATFPLGIKILEFGMKNGLFGYFLTRILKNYCHFWNKHPQVSQKMSF